MGSEMCIRDRLEFTCECLLALAADTPEAIEASYKFNKEGFCKQ